MHRDDLLRLMKTRTGWSLEELANESGITSTTLEAELGEMLSEGQVHKSARFGRWRALGAVKETSTSAGGEWGRRTRILIYSPQILAACPEFTRNTFLHFVEDEEHHFRLRDYVDGQRIEVKEVNGITRSKDLAAAFPRFELEFDDEEEHTPLTDNEFWEKRIAGHNAAHTEMLERSAPMLADGDPA